MPECSTECSNQIVACSVTVKGRLDHAISGQAIPGWKTMDEIDTAVDVDMGDYVVCNDWVGQVRTNGITLFHCGVIEL